MKLFAACICILLAAMAGLSQNTKPKARPGAIENQLTQIERDIGDANVRRDRKFFEMLEADEFVFVDANGGITTKAEDVGSLDKPAGETRLVSYVPSDMTVRVYGKTAVVIGIVTSTYRGPKGEATIRSRFTDVFIRRANRWQLVAGHSSRIRQ